MCFEVALETAHGQMYRSYSPRLIPRSSLYTADNLNKTAAALGIDLDIEPGRTWVQMVNNWNKSPGYVRQAAQIPRKDWWAGEDLGIDIYASGAAVGGTYLFPPGIASVIAVGTLTQSQWDDIVRVTTRLPEIGAEGTFTEDIALIWEEFESFSGKYFVVGRDLQTCATLAGNMAPNPAAGMGAATAGAASASSAAAAATSASGVGTRSATAGAESRSNLSTPTASVPSASAGRSAGLGNAAKRPLNEISEERHISKKSGPSILYQSTIDASKTGVATPAINAWAANDLNRLFSETLVRSASSSERIPYGKLTYLESAIVLDALSHLVDNLKKGGIQDRPISDVKAIHELAVNKDGKQLPVKTLHELSKLTTEEIALAHGIDKPEAARLRQKLLMRTLEALDKSTLPKDAKLLDRRLAHTQTAQIDSERLRPLEESAGLVATGRVYPDLKKPSSLAARNEGILSRVKDLIFGSARGR
jgi:hypothetical protein